MTREEQYQQTVSALKVAHGELLKLEQSGFADAVRDNPALIGDYLIKLRLNCNLLFAFMNIYLEVLSETQRNVAEKRQNAYEEQIKLGKSPNAADNHASNITRLDGANVKVIENKLQSIKNDYERFNGICMSLQSRMREFDTERRVT